MSNVDAKLAAVDRADARIKKLRESRVGLSADDYAGLFEKIYEMELRKIPTTKPPAVQTPSEQATLALSPNTLLLVAHGAEQGGLTTEEGRAFTLHNIAQLLGAKSNVIHNVINTACYGGKCTPEDFQAAFPNVTNVQSADPTVRNIGSITGLAEGKYFATNTTPGIWKRYGTNWFPELPDYTKLPGPVDAADEPKKENE